MRLIKFTAYYSSSAKQCQASTRVGNAALQPVRRLPPTQHTGVAPRWHVYGAHFKLHTANNKHKKQARNKSTQQAVTKASW